MEPNLVQKVRRLRESGQVRRCHIIPHIGEYDVARHCWNAVVLLIELNPEARKELMLHVLLHDAEERWLGDLPATAKWAFPSLRSSYAQAEQRVRDEVGLFHDIGLTEEEQQWAKAVDMLELWMWCHDQLAMGNTMITTIIENCKAWFVRAKENIPVPVWEFYCQYRWRRESDFLFEAF